MSSEPFEETRVSGDEEVAESSEEVGEVMEVEEVTPEFEEAPIMYDVTKPELLETMMIASDILVQASAGLISIDEARKLYEREVIGRVKKLVTTGVVVKKAKKPRTRKKKEVKKEARKKAKKEAKGKKSEGKRRRKKSGESK